MWNWTRIKKVDVNNLTPIEALQLLNKLKNKLNNIFCFMCKFLRIIILYKTKTYEYYENRVVVDLCYLLDLACPNCKA